LDLLLHLIEREELEISEISLMVVTDQYVKTIEQMTERQPDALADFLVIASKLLYIKSRSLLPRLGPGAGGLWGSPEEGEEEDASDALIRQLLEYRQFKAAAASLHEREALGLRSYVRLASPPVLDKQLDLSNLDLAQLQAMLRQALARIPGDPPLPRVNTYPVTVAEQIELVRTFFENGNAARRVVFAELLGRQATRMEVVVTFLAVLELVKQRELVAMQDETFGEIVLAPVEVTGDKVTT
jgi:segregation and condensation protein A